MVNGLVQVPSLIVYGCTALCDTWRCAVVASDVRAYRFKVGTQNINVAHS